MNAPIGEAEVVELQQRLAEAGYFVSLDFVAALMRHPDVPNGRPWDRLRGTQIEQKCRTFFPIANRCGN